MTHNHHHNHHNSHNEGMPLVPVRFEFTDPNAANVSVAGSFNQWKPEAKTLHASGGGRWFKETALAPGNYEYRFIVDGRWMADPMAKETVPNDFGGRNSILTVTSPEQDHRVDAENLPCKSGDKQTT